MSEEPRKGRELLGMPVYAVQEGKRLGEIMTLLVRPSDSMVAAVGIGGGLLRRTHYLPYERLRVVGVDAVMLDSEAVLQHELPAEAVRELDTGLSGRPVLTHSGRRLGTLLGFRVNTATGQIETYRMKPETGVLAQLAAVVLDEGMEIPTSLVHSLGAHALIVDDAAATLGQEKKESPPAG
jgi:uncharacterized protein YrrD